MGDGSKAAATSAFLTRYVYSIGGKKEKRREGEREANKYSLFAPLCCTATTFVISGAYLSGGRADGANKYNRIRSNAKKKPNFFSSPMLLFIGT